MKIQSQDRDFLPGLVYIQESNGTLSFLNNSTPDAIAQVQLAMRSLGRSLLVCSEQPSEAIRQANLSQITTDGKWLVAKTGSPTRLTGASVEAALAEYNTIPRDAVWLVTNKHASQTSGASTPWVHQDASLLIANTVEAKRVAALVLAEAMEQEQRHQAMLAPMRDRLELDLPDQTSEARAGEYQNVGRENRVVIEWENGKQKGFWLDELAGFNNNIQDAQRWVCHQWQPPETAQRWHIVSQPEASSRRTSGWIVSASHVGKLIDTNNPERNFGDYILHPLQEPTDPSVFAMRQSSAGAWTPIEVGERDVVVDFSGEQRRIVYRGPETTLYRPTFVTSGANGANRAKANIALSKT